MACGNISLVMPGDAETGRHTDTNTTGTAAVIATVNIVLTSDCRGKQGHTPAVLCCAREIAFITQSLSRFRQIPGTLDLVFDTVRLGCPNGFIRKHNLEDAPPVCLPRPAIMPVCFSSE